MQRLTSCFGLTEATQGFGCCFTHMKVTIHTCTNTRYTSSSCASWLHFQPDVRQHTPTHEPRPSIPACFVSSTISCLALRQHRGSGVQARDGDGIKEASAGRQEVHSE